MFQRFQQPRTILAVSLLLSGMVGSGLARAEKRPVDVQQSVMKVFVDKSGLFSVFAHNHEILAPLTAGTVEEPENPSVEFLVEAAKLQVLDPKVSAKDRAEIQATMVGPQVLDTERYPEIRFQSTAIEKTGDARWKVRGDLFLHGEMRPVVVEVSEKDGRYRGSATLKQSDFGIKPVSLFGGTVKVKDVVRIEFEIVLAR
jgi:hypothetical protein